MNVKIVTSKAETEFEIPDSMEKLVRTVLCELATGAKSTPK